jgi:hypothetical protein
MTTRTRIFAGCIGSALVLFAVLMATPCASADDKALGEPPLLYRRVLVPADQPTAWPRDGDTFLPIAASDFENWVTNGAANAPRARLIATEYRARLEGTQLVASRGNWEIDLDGESEALLALGQPSIAIEKPAWKDSDAIVQIGWWASATGYALRVPAAGHLSFDWHSPAGTRVAGELRIPLNLPCATRSRLIVDLPAGKVPAIGGGVILENEPVDDSHDMRRWTIALGDAATSELRISDSAEPASVISPGATLHQHLRYHITQLGVDLEASLKLHWDDVAPAVLHLELPAELHLVDAALDGHSLKWQVTRNGNGSASQATIELPDAPGQKTASIALHAIAPLVTDRPSLLPAPRVANVFWTSGSMEIVADKSIEVSQITPIDCIESSAGDSRGKASDAQVRTFDAYAPTAGIQVTVVPRPPRRQVAVGTSLRVGGAGVVGRMVAQVSVAQGSLYRAYAELQPGWTIDAIETIPADALAQWFLDTHDGRNTLELQFNRAIERGDGVTILVTGRRPEPAGRERLARETLTMIDWRDFEITRNLMRLEAAEPFELESIAALPALADDDLTRRDRELVGAAGTAPIIDLQRTRAALALRLAPKRGGYRAEIEQFVAVEPGKLVSRYQVVCRPLQSGVGQVLVFLSQPLPEELQWIEADTRLPILARRMPADDPRLGGLPAGGELWQLNLRGLYARPVTLTATFDRSWSDHAKLPLVSLPEASAQRGQISIHTADVPPIVDVARMSPMPLAAAPNDGPLSPSHPCAAYRYRPMQFYATGEPAEISLAAAPTRSVETLLLATNVDVESVVTADGAARHRLRYELENRGARRVAFQIPAGLRLETANVDGKPVADESIGSILELRLPTNRNSILTLALSSDRPALADGATLFPPVPRAADLQILHGSWTVWLPDELEAVELAAEADRSFNWRRRLFGPLARDSQDGIFNPLRAQDWAGVLPGGLSPAAAVAASADPLRRSEMRSSAPAGWHAHRTTFAVGVPAPITVERRSSLAAWPWLAFLAAAFGMSMLRIRPGTWIVVTAATAILSILFPPWMAAIASGAFLGLLAAPWIRYAWTRSAANEADATVEIEVTKAFASYLVLAAPLALAANSFASEPPIPAWPISRVLIPVDDQQRHVGDKFFVDEEFLRQLLERAAKREHERAWFIHELHCDAQAVPNGENVDASGRWRLTFDLESLTRDVTVTLPLVQADADWPESVSVDGITAPLVWDDGGRSCRIEIAEPGRHRLQIRCLPRIHDDATRLRAELRIPPIARGGFRLSSPVPIAEVRLNAIEVAPQGTEPKLTWECELAGATKLEASWAKTSTASAAAAEPVEQLQWLVLSRDEAALVVRLRTATENAAEETVSVMVDDRWESIEPVAASEPADALLQNAGRLVQLPWKPTADGRSAATARFRLRDNAVLGRWMLPRIEPASGRTTRNLVGISFSDALICEPQSAAIISAADFAAAWGDDAPSDDPQIALYLSESEPGWFLALKPTANQPAGSATAAEERPSTEAPGSAAEIESAPESAPESAVVEQMRFTAPNETIEEDAAATPLATPAPADAGSSEGGTVQLVETTTVVGPAGEMLSHTRFVVDPQGLDHAKLCLPEDAQLLRLSLNGEQPSCERTAPLELRVQMHSSRLPQVVDVVTRAPSSTDSEEGRIILRRPDVQRVSGPSLPVELSLWSLGRADTESHAIPARASTSTAAEQALLRLDKLVSASESASTAAFELPEADARNWFRHWAEVVRIARDTAEEEKLPALEASTVAQVQAVDDPLSTSIARADRWRAEFEQAVPATNDSPAALAVFEPATATADAHWDHFVSERGHTRLAVELLPERASPRQMRIAAIVGIIAVACAASWFARSPAAQEFLREWPLVAGIALGVAVWLWMWPSWLGLAIAIVSAALLVRQAWSRRQNLATVSTLVRSRQG